MKNIKYLLLLLIISCSLPRIVYDYDTQEDFTKYKTFNFFSDAGEGLNEFDIRRIESSIENELLKLGFRLDSLPDFYINYTTKNKENLDSNNLGVGIGGSNGGIGISTGITIGTKKINQQLTIDFVSAKKDELFWQSISESLIKDNLKPDKKSAHYKNLISEMLSKFPPKKRK